MGNIVTDYVIPHSTPGVSQETAPWISNIYRVVRVEKLNARIINLVTGAERTLPCNHLKKLNLSHLAKIKFSTRSEFLNTRLSRLYKNNCYFPPNDKKKVVKPSLPYPDRR